MKRTVYKVMVNNRLFIRTINKSLAERTAASASRDYDLNAEVIEGCEYYEEFNGEGL